MLQGGQPSGADPFISLRVKNILFGFQTLLYLLYERFTLEVLNSFPAIRRESSDNINLDRAPVLNLQ